MRNSSSSIYQLALLTLLAWGASAAAPAVAQQSHLLAVAACPPWKVIPDDPKTTKLMAESCEKDVATIVPALRKAFAIPASNVTTRLNAEADTSGITAAIASLAARAKPADRVVLYFNLHGGAMAAKYAGYDVEAEILATYTEIEPKDFASATADDEWMTVRELRDLIDDIAAEEIVLIFEVCESGASLKDFRYDMARRYKNGWNGREAVIFSSGAFQAATYNEAGTVALFTETFARNLTTASVGNIRDIFESTALETHRSRRATCMKDDNLENFFDDRSVYLDGCTQQPAVFDPYGLLDDIQVGGQTLVSRWNEIKNRKPAPKTAKGEPDPFAWTRSIIGPQTQGYGPAGYSSSVGAYGYYPWAR